MNTSICFSLIRGLNTTGKQIVRNEILNRSRLCAVAATHIHTRSRRNYVTSGGGWTSPSTEDLKSRVALVTGCTSGIGLGIAHSLASRGCHVILNGFGEPDFIKALQEEFVEKYKCRAEFSAADLTKQDEVKEMCEFALKQFPEGVDILVNNAGFQHVCPVEDFAEERWDAMIAIMLTTPFQTIKYLLPSMKEKRWGRIVNVASVHGVRASPLKAAYVSAKHGVVGLTKVVGLETAGTGVTCNALCPGFVDTPILKMQVKALAEKEGISYDEAKGKFLANFHPTKEPVGIDQLGDMVAFLCSDSGGQMTGQAVVMDGGWTAK